MKRTVMGLAAGCLLASGVWGAALPFECVGGTASVSVPEGVTAVTVTFEAELPAGTS